MNKERYNQIIDEVYEKWIYESCNGRIYPNINEKEQFINRIKTEPKFSERWGLKIEESELSEGERLWICSQKHHIRFGTNDGPPWYSPDNPDRDKLKWMTESQRGLCDYKNIPTKLITISYNNETIEIYE